jgi:uncharacterized membrane protein
MRAALLPQPDSEARERSSIEHFSESLPKLPTRRFILGLISCAILITILVAAIAPPQLSSFLTDAWFQLVRLDFGAFYASVRQLDGRSGLSLEDLGYFYLALLLMALSFYLPATLLVGSFRTYRNLMDELPRDSSTQAMFISTSRASDRVSMLESSLLSRIGVRALTDLQVDLLRSALIPALVVLSSVVLPFAFALEPSMRQDFCKGWIEGRAPNGPATCPSITGQTVIISMLVFPFVVLALARLRWIVWTWQSRNLAVRYLKPATRDERRTHRLAEYALYCGAISNVLPCVGVFVAAAAIYCARKTRKELSRSPNRSDFFAASTGQLLGFAAIVWLGVIIVAYNV